MKWAFWRCDPSKKNPLAGYVCRQFGAVPVLPVQPRLDVLKVLMKCDNGQYCNIGDLADVCIEGESKNFLRNVIHERDSSYIITSAIFGPEEAGVRNHGDWSVNLLAFDTGPSLGLRKLSALDIKVPSHQSIAVAEGKFNELLDKVTIDDKASIFRRKGQPMKEIVVYVVQEVIKVSALEVTASNVNGAHVGLAVPAVVVPMPIDINLHCDRSSEGRFRITGPVEDGKIQLFPVAFKGWRCVFKYGKLYHCGRATFAYDSPDGDELIQHEEEMSKDDAGHHDHPLDDPNIGEWFASIQVTMEESENEANGGETSP